MRHKGMEKISLIVVVPPLKRLSNGDTELQLLARSRYLLFKYDTDWTKKQRERVTILFKLYPDLKKSYEIIKKFRGFYNLKNQQNIPKLQEWFKYVGVVEISEIQNFTSSVSRHQNKIQRFLINNHGTRDPDFLFFRLQKLLC